MYILPDTRGRQGFSHSLHNSYSLITLIFYGTSIDEIEDNSSISYGK